MSRWSERKRSVDVLNVLEDWIVINGKSDRVMHDYGKQFTSNILRHFLLHNHIKDKRIPNRDSGSSGEKVEAYNKIVKNEFLAVEDIPNINDGKLRYDIFVKRCRIKPDNTEGLMVLLHQRCFYKELITSTVRTITKQ